MALRMEQLHRISMDAQLILMEIYKNPIDIVHGAIAYDLHGGPIDVMVTNKNPIGIRHGAIDMYVAIHLVKVSKISTIHSYCSLL